MKGQRNNIAYSYLVYRVSSYLIKPFMKVGISFIIFKIENSTFYSEITLDAILVLFCKLFQQKVYLIRIFHIILLELKYFKNINFFFFFTLY